MFTGANLVLALRAAPAILGDRVILEADILAKHVENRVKP
jgi:hypothetical protein